MSNQQIDSGASMPDEQVEVQSATHPDTPATEQQAPVDQAIHLIVRDMHIARAASIKRRTARTK